MIDLVLTAIASASLGAAGAWALASHLRTKELRTARSTLVHAEKQIQQLIAELEGDS